MKKEYISPQLSEIKALEDRYLAVSLTSVIPEENKSENYEQNSDALIDTDFD